jgi:hypothetical protein
MSPMQPTHDEWAYRVSEAGVWINPPASLLRAHPEDRAALTGALLRELASGPLLVRGYALDPPPLLKQLQQARLSIQSHSAAEPGCMWIDARCDPDRLPDALISSWGVALPDWVCVQPAVLPLQWSALLSERMQQVTPMVDPGGGIFALAPAATLPADGLLAYGIDEGTVVARPEPARAVAALEQLAQARGYQLTLLA